MSQMTWRQEQMVVRHRSGGGRGRRTQRESVIDVLQQDHRPSAVKGTPTTNEFLKLIRGEMLMRKYEPQTWSTYQSHIVALMRWHGGKPNQVTRADVHDFLVMLAETGASSSKLSGSLSAIRTVFDDLCCRQVTIGFVTPRRSKKLPVILSMDEVQRLIDGCRSQRDKMLVSLIYATGLRVSEVARLEWCHVDFDRNCINVVRGKGRKDRQVMLPESYRALLKAVSEEANSQGYIFPGEGGREGRHLSVRTIQRCVENAVAVAGIAKKVTPHSLRHAFATHLFESGTNIRLIQKLLGHANLETTCIYTHVAHQANTTAISPLDQLHKSKGEAGKNHGQKIHGGKDAAVDVSGPEPEIAAAAFLSTAKPSSVGRMQLHVDETVQPDGVRAVVIEVLRDGQPSVHLEGVRVSMPRDGWVQLEIPTLSNWEPELAKLSVEIRDRIAEPEFCRVLQSQLLNRLTKEEKPDTQGIDHQQSGDRVACAEIGGEMSLATTS